MIYAGTFSKPCAPGLKTGYALMPPELIEPLVRLKGNHDFGSNNLSQHIICKLLKTVHTTATCLTFAACTGPSATQ